MRSTTIVHRSSAPQIPTPQPDLGRSGCSIWPRFRCDDFAFHGIGPADSTRSFVAWRKGVAHQKIRQASMDRGIRGPSSPPVGPWATGHPSVMVVGRCAGPWREGVRVEHRSPGTVGRQARDGQRRSPVPGLASVRDNVPRRSPVIGRCTPRSRSSVGERPPHTRKVAGSIPAGTTSKTAEQSRFCGGPLQVGRVHSADLYRFGVGASVAVTAPHRPASETSGRCSSAFAVSSPRRWDASPGERRRRRVALATTWCVVRRRRCARTRRIESA